MKKNEYTKLDAIDRKVLRWLIVHSPESVESWIDLTTEHYRLACGLEIHRDKLLAEIVAGLVNGN